MRSKPSNWLPAVLGDYIKITSGFAFKSNQFADTGSIPIARIRDVKRGFSETYYTGDYDEKYLIQNGDLLIGMDGEFNAALWSGGQALLNQRVCRIRTIETLDFDFLRFLLPIELKKIEDRTPFVTVKHISTEQIRSIEFLFPPLEEQRRIAAILDKADAVRQKRQEAIALTEELLRSAFLEMFGDPDTNPKGWEIVPIESVAASTRNALAIGPFGSSLKVDDYRKSGHPVVFVRDIRENQFNWVSEVFVDDRKFQELQSHHVRPGDIVATKMGLPPCIAAVYPNSMPIGVVTADIIKVTSDRTKMTPLYVAAAINSDFCKRQVARFTEGITRPKVTLRDFKQLLIPCPPLSYQERWEALCNQHQIATARLSTDFDNLNNLFNSLLQRAFRGKL